MGSSKYISALDGVVAQLVERLVRNEKVAGSIPVGSTILNTFIIAALPLILLTVLAVFEGAY